MMRRVPRPGRAPQRPFLGTGQREAALEPPDDPPEAGLVVVEEDEVDPGPLVLDEPAPESFVAGAEPPSLVAEDDELLSLLGEADSLVVVALRESLR